LLKETFDHFGFGLSGWAQPIFAKVSWFFFSKKEPLSCPCPAPADVTA
jgi:hypothetical protein